MEQARPFPMYLPGNSRNSLKSTDRLTCPGEYGEDDPAVPPEGPELASPDGGLRAHLAHQRRQLRHVGANRVGVPRGGRGRGGGRASRFGARAEVVLREVRGHLHCRKTGRGEGDQLIDAGYRVLQDTFNIH